MKNAVKSTNEWKLKTNKSVKNSMRKLKNKKKTKKKNQKQITMKHNDPKTMGHRKSNSKRDVYRNTITSKTRKISNKQHKLTPKTTGKSRKNKQQKEGNHKDLSRSH